MEHNSANEHNATEATPVVTTPVTATTFEINETTIMAALSYLGPLVLIPFLVKKGDPFVTFHVKQGLILFGLGLILYVLSEILFQFIMPLVSLANLVLLILTVIGIINALQRKDKELPFIGSYASHIKL